MEMNEVTQNAYNKSVGKGKEKSVRVKVKKLRMYIAVMSISIGLAGTGIIQLGKNVVDQVNKKIVVSEAIESSRQFVHSEAHRVENNPSMYYYDISDIAKYISSNEDDLYQNLYGVFTTIGYNKQNRNEQMTEIVRRVFEDEQGQSLYDTFDEFLADNGFVDKEGNPSTKKYDDQMQDYIYAKEQFKTQEENIKGIK